MPAMTQTPQGGESGSEDSMRSQGVGGRTEQGAGCDSGPENALRTLKAW